MRLGLIGDVHCSPLLRIACDFFDRSEVDHVLCVGDLCDGPGSLADTIALVRTRSVRCVRGNHDRWLLEDRMRSLPDAQRREELDEGSLAWLRALPVRDALDRDRIALTHALFDDDMSFVREDTRAHDVVDNPAWQRAKRALPSMRVLVTGHTHARMIRRIDGILFVNPGTLHVSHSSGFLLVEIDHAPSDRARVFDFEGERIVERATISLRDARS